MPGVVMPLRPGAYTFPDVIEQLQDMQTDGAHGLEKYEMTLVADISTGSGMPSPGYVICEVRISVIMPGDWRPGKRTEPDPIPELPSVTPRTGEPPKKRERSDASKAVFGEQ